MNETVLLWVLGTLVLCLGALAGLFWRHIEHCREVHADLAEIKADLKHVMADIGTHETGIRGTVHKTSNMLIVHEGRLDILEGKYRSDR